MRMSMESLSESSSGSAADNASCSERSRIRTRLQLARYAPLDDCPHRVLLPVVKLGEQKTHAPWMDSACPGLVVKAEELLARSGLETNPAFRRISHAGGLGPFLGFTGNIVLSSIMPDRALRGLEQETYANIINTLKPTYYITPDAETYFGEERQSEKEIERILNQTKYLLDACQQSRPLGLVKGCTLAQVDMHVDGLTYLGVSQFVFHAGDYLSRGSTRALDTARLFARHINRKVPWLLVYGLGSERHLRRFNFAQGFVTQSHFVNAFYGKRSVDGLWLPFRGGVTRSIIMQNLRGIEEHVISLECQGGLRQWMEEREKSTVRALAGIKRSSLKSDARSVSW